MHYHNVVGTFFDNKWAIMPEVMPKLVQVVNRWAAGVKLDKEAAAEAVAAGRPRKLEAVSGNVAVLPLFGIVAQRLSMMAELSEGGTSTEMFGAAFDRLLGDSSVGAIVLNIDSPGGSVYGVEELANKIYSARGTKPIYAVANSLAASAAYWIGTAADRLFVTPSGEVGSVGVLAMHVDYSNFNEKMGVTPTYIHAGKYKVEGHSDAPLDDEAKRAIQASVDDYYDSFTSAIARHRGVSQRDVKSGFGEGRVVRGAKATEMGMADGVKTLEAVLGELTRSQKPAVKRTASGFKEKRELQRKHGGVG
jgi:signal peptide peptidase SppA